MMGTRTRFFFATSTNRKMGNTSNDASTNVMNTRYGPMSGWWAVVPEAVRVTQDRSSGSTCAKRKYRESSAVRTNPMTGSMAQPPTPYVDDCRRLISSLALVPSAS